jgi:hypothetical protein
MQKLRFRASHLAAVQAGTKRITMRFNDPVQVALHPTDQATLVRFEVVETDDGDA